MSIFPSKILAIKIRALGDSVLMTGPLLDLAELFPNAEIHVLVLKPWAPIFENFPRIQKVWGFHRRASKLAHFFASLQLAWQLRKEKFDTIVHFHAGPSSALLSRVLGAQIRAIHFHGHRDANRYSTVPIAGKGVVKPILERDRDTVRALGFVIKKNYEPRVFLQTEEILQLKKLLPWRNAQKPFLVIGLGASRPTKNWGIEKFAEVAIRWIRECQGQVLAFSGPLEKTLVEKIDLSIPEDVRNSFFFGSTFSIRELASILMTAHVFLGNDSGPKHLAIAVGTPTVSLFGPEDPFEWHPYARDLHPYFFIDALPCRRSPMPEVPAWCGLYECQLEGHVCMKKIEAGSVFETCKTLLENRAQRREE